ncbi:TatD family hydrolase [Corynebacterium sp. H127]|uniref:TatD family hydrolase n=1 Tax=Corynebacterium sp. H127 TaxID=3133418 RepID=UPI0030A089A7
MLLDTHLHLDFVPASQRTTLLAELAESDVQVVAQTVLPSEFQVQPGTLPSLGFHPWWVGPTFEEELETFANNLPQTRCIGEIGLDFSPRRVESAPLQLEALRRIFAFLKDRPYVLSIHAVRAATEVLDMLPDNVIPVFHRFSGTSDELTRLMQIGGYFSVHPSVLEGKKGRAYVKQVPENRLLLESDLPASTSAVVSAGDVVTSLRGTLETLSELRGQDMAPVIKQTQQEVYFS